MRAGLRRAWLSAAVVLLVAGPAAAQRYLPSLQFQTLTTPHFWIHFHQGERELAARLAVVAEATRERLLAGRPLPPPGRTHVILSGQDDAPNGWATSTPFNVIELRASWPRASSTLGNTDDWLTLVFTHEYAHILHLDRSGGIFRVARQLFGRAPFTMPNLFLPAWQVEGLATVRESASGAGRVNDGSVRRVLTAALRAGRFEPIDRVSGGLVTWPDGAGAYFYGGLFNDYLARRYGQESLERWTSATARWPPFFGMFAFKQVYGTSMSQAWRDFAASWPASSPAPSDRFVPVSREGFETASPRWDSSRPATLYYGARTPHAFPALVRVDTASGTRETVAGKFLGDSISVRGGRVLFDQLDLAANTAVVSDLYLLGPDGSAVRRLTSASRIGDADLAPDAASIVAVQSQADRRALVRFSVSGDGDVTSPTTIVSEPGVAFSGPRWSPDGRRLVAERARTGHLPDVVIVDVDTGAVEPVAPGIGARQATPTWAPDGRTVVFAAATAGEPFNICAVSLDEQRAWRVTARPEGARAPDVSPDGTRLAFLGYTVRGEDVFAGPFDRSQWTPIDAPALPDRTPVPAVPQAGSAAEVRVGSYSPFQSLWPRYWLPIAESGDDGVAAGAMTSGLDVLGRHAYTASLSIWSETRRAEWDVSYAYQRFKPALLVAASGDSRAVEDGILSSRTVSAGVALPFLTARRSQEVVAAVRRERVSLEAANGARPSIDRNAVRLGWAFANSNTFGYSVSADEGIEVGIVSEHVLEAIGASGRADAVAGEARAFVGLGGPHRVLAVRAAGALSGGDRRVRQLFTVDGAGPTDNLLAFDSDTVALFRGDGLAGVAGTRAAVVNVDYRFPIWRIERGAGVYPGFLRWMHGAVFMDTADAWTRGRTARPRIAAGVEVSADVVLGYGLPVTLTGGVSWRVDGTRPDSNRPHVFARVGRAF